MLVMLIYIYLLNLIVHCFCEITLALLDVTSVALNMTLITYQMLRTNIQTSGETHRQEKTEVTQTLNTNFVAG